MKGATRRLQAFFSFYRNQSGAVAVLTAVLMIVLLGFMAFAVDLGVLEYQKRKCQKAADAAAISAATAIQYGENVTTAAQASAVMNGFSISEVAVTYPYNAKATQVQVIVSKSQPTYFARIFNIDTMAVSAKATAANNTNCIYALNDEGGYDGGAAFSMILGYTEVTSPCGVIVNSASSWAVLNAVDISRIDVPYFGLRGGVTQVLGYINWVKARPTTLAAAVPDPLDYLQAPNVAGLPEFPAQDVSGAETLSPGIYTGKIRIRGGAIVTFNPGLYILNAGMEIEALSIVTGNGVTFYNKAGAIKLAGVSYISLTAPTMASATGPSYPGILFFQAKNNSSGAEITGVNYLNLTGALYFKIANLTIKGINANIPNSDTIYNIIVADKIQFTGVSIFRSNYSSLPGGSPVGGGVQLIE